MTMFTNGVIGVFHNGSGFSNMVPKRRHKKKRINKKWAKRYGYITKFKDVKLEDVHFDNSNEGLEILGTISKGEFYYD